MWLWEEGSISLKYLSQIVSARYEEILQYVREELKVIWKDGMLPEWVVLVGWASKEKWLLSLSKEVLRLPSFIGIPNINDDLVDAQLNDPSFSAVIWNMILANKYGIEHSNFSINLWWIWDSILKLFKKIMP